MRRAWTATAAATTATLLAGTGLAVALAVPASGAAPRLSVSKASLGAGAENVRVTVTGRGYLVPPHQDGAEVFGGVYVFFGWVKPGGKWGPSHRNSGNNNGTFGVTYNYPGEQGDAGTRDTGAGSIRFVSFTSGGISGEATPYHMDADGNWSAQVTIPGATYTYRDAGGAKHKVDCREVTCGVYTIGAHGKASQTNELFTPITFAAAKPSTTPKPSKTPEPSTTPEPSKTPKPSRSPSSEPTKTPVPSKKTPSPPASSTTEQSPTVSVPSSSPTDAPSASTPPTPAATVAALAADTGGASSAGLWGAVGAVVLAAAAGGAWFLRGRKS